MRKVDAVAIIGAGPTGSRVAQFAALGGYTTIIEDLLPNARRRAESEIRTSLERQVESKAISPVQAADAWSRIQFAESVEEAARSADLVIETVPDELESKLEIFILLDKICRPGTIFASHSRFVSITEIARATYRADDCIGTRFLNPSNEAAKLELVRAQQTSDATLCTVLEVAQRMGFTPQVVADIACDPVALPSQLLPS